MFASVAPQQALDPAADAILAAKLFDDRRKLMDMFDDDLDEMLTPSPTYTYSLKPYFNLNYSENDMLAICNLVFIVLHQLA